MRTDDRIEIGSITVMVFGKPANLGGTSAEALPDLLVDAFVLSVHGLIPTATVHALAAVRDGLPEVVARLGAELDPGYVRHCLQLDHAEDGTDHLRALVAEELRSIIDQDLATASAAGMTGLMAWIDEPGRASRLKVGRDVILRHLLREERAHAAANSGITKGKYDGIVLPTDDSHPERDDELLAFRMTFRALDLEGSGAALEPGVVLREVRDGSAEGEYFVCVQPSCDAVRLAPPCTSIAFLPCETVTSDFHFVVMDGAEAKRLSVVSRFDQICQLSLPVDPGRRVVLLAPLIVEVIQEKGEDDRPGRRFEVIAALRPDHARRLGQNLGNRFGRIGLDESSWQQRHTGRALR